MSITVSPVKVATKKITSLFFILSGFTPLLFVLFFNIRQQSIRHQMKVKMEQQLLHTITLPDGDIIWVKKGKEIFIHGKMFDIKSMEHKNGMTTFYGLYDEEETLLKKNLMAGLGKNQSLQNQLLAQLIQCWQNIYADLTGGIPLCSGQSEHMISLIAPDLQKQFKTIPTPPPQV